MKSRVLPGGIKKGGEERENHRNVFFVATTSRTKCNLSGCIERKKGKEKTTKHPMEEITDVHIQETPTETVNKKKKNDKYLKVKIRTTKLPSQNRIGSVRTKNKQVKENRDEGEGAPRRLIFPSPPSTEVQSH